MTKRGRPALSAELHRVTGTFRPSRHGLAAVAASTSKAPTSSQAPRATPPPVGLTPASRRWWRSIVTGWAIEAPHLRLLVLAAQAFDDAQRARDELRRDGATIRTPSGYTRAHPAVRREHDARLAFARLMAALGLEE